MRAIKFSPSTIPAPYFVFCTGIILSHYVHPYGLSFDPLLVQKSKIQIVDYQVARAMLAINIILLITFVVPVWIVIVDDIIWWLHLNNFFNLHVDL